MTVKHMKEWVSVLLAVILLAGLTACDGGETGSAPTAVTTAGDSTAPAATTTGATDTAPTDTAPADTVTNGVTVTNATTVGSGVTADRKTTTGKGEKEALRLALDQWHPGVPGRDVSYTLVATTESSIIRTEDVTYTCSDKGATIKDGRITIPYSVREKGKALTVTAAHKDGRKATLSVPVRSWAMSFSDEFNGSSLDTSKWSLAHMRNDTYATSGDPNKCLSFKDGYLYMSALKEETRENGQVSQYLVPAIETYGKYNQKLGYFAVSMKVPEYSGLLSAFWLLPPGAHLKSALAYKEGYKTAIGEIDIAEISNAWSMDTAKYKQDRQSGIALFQTDGSGSRGVGYTNIAGIKPAERFYEYGCVLDEDACYFYVDGVCVGRELGLAPGSRENRTLGAYMKLDLCMAATEYQRSWFGEYGFTDKDFPLTLTVDWVRAYSAK